MHILHGQLNIQPSKNPVPQQKRQSYITTSQRMMTWVTFMNLKIRQMPMSPSIQVNLWCRCLITMYHVPCTYLVALLNHFTDTQFIHEGMASPSQWIHFWNDWARSPSAQSCMSNLWQSWLSLAVQGLLWRTVFLHNMLSRSTYLTPFSSGKSMEWKALYGLLVVAYGYRYSCWSSWQQVSNSYTPCQRCYKHANCLWWSLYGGSLWRFGWSICSSTSILEWWTAIWSSNWYIPPWRQGGYNYPHQRHPPPPSTLLRMWGEIKWRDTAPSDGTFSIHI